ncbi:MAG TPA: pyridoxal phosphate-dependent aminotransferase [Phaeodactylibacter sp.]|nr:pyridoxal phosphate-dependent aminotransferase [Phaeodactylibacter sp.]
MSSADAQSILSERILKMKESATLRMAQLARDVAAQGHQVISLSLGEPDFDTPQHIKEAAMQALRDGFTKYTPVPGLVELRQAISQKFKEENNLDYGIDQIVVSNGAKQTIANICMALLDKGDEVVILAPFWVSYSAIVKLAGGVPVYVSAGIEQDYKVSAQQLQAAITSKTKFVLFSSPCNPTGSVFTEGELRAFAKIIAARQNLYVVADEIYEYINFTPRHFSIGSIEEIKHRVITVNGFSKGFAMTGWRLGYMGAPAFIAKACAKIQGQNTSGACAFGQKAAVTALTSDKAPSRAMRAAYLKRRDLMISLLNDIPGLKTNHPQGAFYIFPDCSYYFGKSHKDHIIHNADDLSAYLMNVAHVGVVSGTAFGADNCFRISYAASEEDLREAMRRVGEALEKLTIRN